jgi:hypothetical protein
MAENEKLKSIAVKEWESLAKGDAHLYLFLKRQFRF